MPPRLITLAFAPFAFGTTAFIFIGLIAPIATDLRVAVPVVGQLQTVFAVACAVGAPLLARRLGETSRRRVLVAVMGGLVAVNVASAIAPTLSMMMAARLLGGLFAGLSLPLASSIAVACAPDEKRPAAIALVLGGYTLAFIFGVPLGSVVGAEFGWRAAFWFAAAVSVVAMLTIWLAAPRQEPPPQPQGLGFKDAIVGENRLLMLVTLAAFIATFVSIAFTGPVVTLATGLEGSAIGGLQLATGVGSIIGLPAGAMLAKLPARRALTMLFLAILATQALFSVAMLNDLGWAAIPATIVAMGAGSAALFATSPIIQSRLSVNAGAAATIAFALNGSMVYFGQGLGSMVGGSVAAVAGLEWVGFGGAAVALVGLMLASRLRGAQTRSDAPAGHTSPAE
ncbi:MAG: MFS transporter [Pseudomonadota bacterium]